MDCEERFELRNARWLAADYLRRALRPGDTAVDATVGNGGDTLALCELVGETGHVIGFDVQQTALERTRERLEQAGVLARAELLLCGHERMREHVHTAPQAVVFNLGWLPGAEHAVTTRTETTLVAVRSAAELIAPGGIVTVCVYPGHEEGQRELEALLDWAAGLDVRIYNVLHHRFVCAPARTPRQAPPPPPGCRNKAPCREAIPAFAPDVPAHPPRQRAVHSPSARI